MIMDRRTLLKGLFGGGVLAAIGGKKAKANNIETSLKKSLDKQPNTIYVEPPFGPALKLHRYINELDQCCFCDISTPRGIIVESVPTAFEYGNIVRPGQHPKGKPAGLLLNDVVEFEFIHHPAHWYIDITQVGGKVSICKQGIVTVRVQGNPSHLDTAYYDVDGIITTKKLSQPIGHFITNKDENHFAQVRISI
jgi:hypothetical protein